MDVSRAEPIPAEPDLDEPAPSPDLSPPEIPLWEPSLGQRIREAWDSRHLLPGLARSSIPTHRGLILGRAWLVLRPALQVFGFAVIFGGIFNATAPNDVPYLLFLVFNLQAFQLFQITVLYETVSTQLVRPITRPLRFPLLLVPVAALARVLVRLAVYWAIALGILAYYGVVDRHLYLQLDTQLLIGLAGVLLCLAFGLALGLITSAIYPRARDMRYFVRYAMQLWILFTPVFYSIQALPEPYQLVAQINPLTGIVGMVQHGFLDAGGLRPYGVAWSLVALVLTTAFGLWFFNRFATRWVSAYSRPDDEADEDEGLL